jgi:hypothetical protein
MWVGRLVGFLTRQACHLADLSWRRVSQEKESMHERSSLSTAIGSQVRWMRRRTEDAQEKHQGREPSRSPTELYKVAFLLAFKF